MRKADADELLIRLDENVKIILLSLEDAKKWRDTHEEKDSERFEKLHERIDGMQKFYTSVAAVAGAIGISIAKAPDTIITFFSNLIKRGG